MSAVSLNPKCRRFRPDPVRSARIHDEREASMPKFMLILGGADLDKRSGNPDFAPKMLEQYSAWVRSLADAGNLVETYKLFDQTGARLSVRGGEVVDGPFLE